MRISVTRTTRQRRTLNARAVVLRAMLVCWIFLVAVGMVGFGGGFRGSVSAQDAGLESLKRQSLPWYDAATEQVRQVELGARDDPRSGLRGTVPKKQPVSKSNSLEGFFDDWNLAWASGLGTLLYWLIWIGLGVAFVILIVWVVRNVEVRQPVARKDSESTRSLAQSVAQLPFQVEVGDDDFRSLAAKAFHSNDFRTAIVWLFSHVLVSLDQRDLIRLKKGKTNRQYLRELAGDRELSAYYADVMLPFEATFFGDKDLDRDQFVACWDRLEVFEQQVNAVGGTA